MNKAWIGSAKNGNRGPWRAKECLLAARALEVDVNWLVLGEGAARPLLYRERAGLSEQATYVGSLLDKFKTPALKDAAYAIVVNRLTEMLRGDSW